MYKTIEEFRKDYEEARLSKISVENLYLEYRDKVHPYIGFISSIRLEDGRPNEAKIRKVLGVRTEYWKEMKKLEGFREVLDLDRDYMKYQARKKVIDLVDKDLSKGSVELMLKTFDDEYGTKKVSSSSLPTHLKIEFIDASVDEEEAEKRAGLTSKK